MRHFSLLTSPFPLLLFCSVCCHSVAAQDTIPDPSSPTSLASPAATSHSSLLTSHSPSLSTHSTLFGIGGLRQLDTYLSPLNYRGPQLLLLKEKLRPTHLLHSRVSYQGILQADFSPTHNPADNAKNLAANISYSAAWHYNWHPLPPLRILAGPQLTANGGFIYNTRNGNNPAQALLSADIAASAAAIYTFRLWGHTMRLREQLDIPLIGLMFSPNYNQSYYEIFSLGNYDHNICFTYPGNRPNLRSQLTLDFPLLRTTIRVGYLIDVRQSHVNNLRHHAYTHAFLIGWVKHFQHRTHRQAAAEPFIM